MRLDEATLAKLRDWKFRVRHRGASLVFMIAAIVVIGALGAGVVLMTSGSSQNELAENRHLRAYYLALSGQNVWSVKASDLTAGTTYTFSLGSDSFTVQTISTGSTYTVNTRGIVNGGSLLESNFPLSMVSRTPPSSSSTSGGDVLNSPLDAIVTDPVTHVATVDDNSPNSNPGIVKGRVSGAVEVVDGVINNALHFDCGDYGRVVYAGISAYNIYYSGSISMWFKADDFDNQNAGLLHKGQSNVACQSSDSSTYIFSDEVYTFQFTPGSSSNYVRLRFVIVDGPENTSCSTTSSTCLCRGSTSWKSVYINSNKQFQNSTRSGSGDTGKWFYVVATWLYESATNKTTLNLYINGVLDKTVIAQPFTPRTNTSPIVLGSQQDANTNVSGSVFCGAIDDVNVYSYPLTLDAIKKYYCKYMTTAAICN